MSDCHMCKHYYEELDVNFAECKVNESDEAWEGKIDCKSFESREEYDEENN